MTTKFKFSSPRKSVFSFIVSRDKDYIVKDGKVQIIDEFTGRILGGRRFSDGLHKPLRQRNVSIQENQTLASIIIKIILGYIKNYQE